jgi:hypothetical protein
MMRGVIERAVAEERVSLLHLAARQTDAMAPEKFDRQDEKRGVEALLHAIGNMTYGQLVEWQSLGRHGPAWQAHRMAQTAPSAATGATASADPVEAGEAAPPAAAAPPASAVDDEIDEPEAGDDIKAALRERCPWPGMMPPRQPGTLPGGGFASAPCPTAGQAADPAMAPAPEIRPPEGEALQIWPWTGDGPEPQPSADGAKPRIISMPRVVLSRLPLGKPIPDWIEQEPPGGWRQRPT